MEQILTRSLIMLGCTQKHVKFYLALFALGPATMSEIIKKSRLQRSTAYLIATDLIELRLIREDHKPYKKQFIAAEPDYILQKLEAKHRQLGRNNIAYSEALPELRTEYRSPLAQPRVHTYTGKAGLLAVWKDILETKQEILLWTNQEIERLFFGEDIHDAFIKERIQKGIATRVLAVDSPRGKELQSSDDSALRQTQLLPAEITFTSETYIYGDKIAILDVGNDFFCVITESRQIADSHRAVFELTWNTNYS